MIHPTLDELRYVAGRALYGLLQSALARPRATAFGVDAYPTLEDKAAAPELAERTRSGGRAR